MHLNLLLLLGLATSIMACTNNAQCSPDITGRRGLACAHCIGADSGQCVGAEICTTNRAYRCR
ncbi:hypothetical protein Vi05172_g9364 [Venturia inaequalis]|nr:hypothetical protein Vi05172_g9364 [Venturia inaequalis]